MSEPKPTFAGEVQFRRWSDSSTQGVQVTFALPDSESLEPLKAKAGKRFMAVLVEIGDDEQPVQPQPREKPGALCIEACQYCIEPDFWRYIRSQGVECNSEADAKQYVLDFCDVTSRRKLDTNPEAGVYFRDGIRVPFLRWQREQRKAA